jgi:D-tyrosyl-tRNA(Tyr) deacylase
MRALLQRVSEAKIVVDGKVHNEIGKGLLILLGVEFEDTEEDARWLCGKIAKMRLFPDQDGRDEPERTRGWRGVFGH